MSSDLRHKATISRRVSPAILAGAVAYSTMIAPTYANSAVEGLVDRLDRSCSTPGFDLEQRVASFAGWNPVRDDALPSVIDALVQAFMSNGILSGQFSAEDTADFGARMLGSLAERATASADDSRALRLLALEDDPTVSVAIEVTQSARFNLTICRLVLSAPTPETVAELMGYFRLSHEMTGPNIRHWSIGTTDLIGEDTVQLGRALSILTTDDGSEATVVLAFTTQTTSY